MLEPYKLVAVNTIFCFILLAGVLIYRFVYPKKKINLLMLLILISLLPLLSMLRAGTYQSGDLSLHAVRTMSFFKILFHEHIIPRWAPEFYAGYGDPYFMFSYFLPYFIGSLFHLVGFSFLASLKLLMAVSYILSGIFMYFFIKDELGEKAGFTAAIFYLFSPFHLVNMHFQVTIAQTLSYLFLPLCLYLTKKIISSPRSSLLIILSIVEALFIMSHQVISMIFLPIMISYALFLFRSNIKVPAINLAKYSVSILIGLMLSSFYWLPIVSESQFTAQALNKQFIIFPSIVDLLYSPWRSGFLFQGHMGELSYVIGYTQIFVVIFSLFLFFRKSYDKRTRKMFLFFTCVLAILLFFILSLSKPLWYSLPFLKFFQFSARLLVPLSLCISVLSAIVVRVVKIKAFFIILCSITVLYTILNWGNRTTIPSINDATLIKENKTWPPLGPSVGLEPSSPIWSNLNKNISMKKRTADIEILYGNAEIKLLSRTSTSHMYVADVKSEYARIKENTFYFPEWILKIDGNQKNIEYKSQDHMGIITFELKKGTHKIEVSFVDSKITKFSNFLSLTTAALLVIYFIKTHLTYFRQFLYFLRLS